MRQSVLIDLIDLEDSFNCRRQGLWAFRRSEARHDVSVAVNEELGEIPSNCVDSEHAENSGPGLFQKTVQRMSVRTIYVDLAKNGKCDAVIPFAEGGDLGRRTGFLGAELVAWEAQNLKPAVLVYAVKIFEPCVLSGESAFAGGIHNEQNLTSELVQVHGVSVEQWRREFIDGTP